MTATKTKNPAALRTAIYTRVSSDKSGRARSPMEQEAEARAEAERRGWTVVDVYMDNDVSASRFAKKGRPEFDRMLDALSAGKLDVITSWEASRLTRDTEVFAALGKLCRTHNVLLSYSGRLLDLDNPEDEFSAGLDNLVSVREAAVARKRTMRALAANLEAGRAHGRVQYGYAREYDHRTGAFIRQVADPDAAPAVILMFEGVAAGRNLTDIADQLNAEGYTTRTGLPWTRDRVYQQVDQGLSYTGVRVHKGQAHTTGDWPALITKELYDAAHAQLAVRRRPGTSGKGKHLLSGILKCHKCGGKLWVLPASNGNRARYSCFGVPGVTKGRCVSRGQDLVDTYVVEELLFPRLARKDALAMFSGASAAEAAALGKKLDGLKAELAEAEEEFLATRLSAKMMGALEAKLTPQIAELEEAAKLAVADLPDVVKKLAGGDVRGKWEAYSPEDRRLVVATLFSSIVVNPAQARGRWNTGVGIAFTWRNSTEEYVVP